MPELISPAAYRILRLLVGKPPQSIAQLTKASGVTRTAVIEQLNELMAKKYVEREVDKGPRRGRPRHLYTSTPLALDRVFPPSRHLLSSLMQAIEACGGVELRDGVFAQLANILAVRYLPELAGLESTERLERLVQILRSEGAVVDLEVVDGHLSLRERSCPFVGLVDEDRAACEMEQQLLSGLIGSPVIRTECRLDGCNSCVFQLTSLEETEAPPRSRALPAGGPAIADPVSVSFMVQGMHSHDGQTADRCARRPENSLSVQNARVGEPVGACS